MRNIFSQDIFSNYHFFKKIPISYTNASVLKTDFVASFKRLPTDFTIYAEKLKAIHCFRELASAAFPLYFVEGNVDIINMYNNMSPNVLKALLKENIISEKMAELAADLKRLSIEYNSFFNYNIDQMFRMNNPNCDRSEERKNQIASLLEQTKSQILKQSKDKEEFIYVGTINDTNFVDINRFLTGKEKTSLFPKLINPNFFLHLTEEILTPHFKICVHDLKSNTNYYFVTSFAIANFFSSKVSNIIKESMKTNKFSDLSHTYEINIFSCEKEGEFCLIDPFFLFSTDFSNKYFNDVPLFFRYYYTYKDLSDFFDYSGFKRAFSILSQNFEILEHVKQDALEFVNLQEKLFSITENKYEEILFFLKDSFWKDDLPEINHQLYTCSKYRPKKYNLYQKLLNDIETENKRKGLYQDFVFKELYKADYTEYEKLFVDDDIKSLEIKSGKIPFNENEKISCGHFFFKKQTVPLISVACFYGAIKCFKFLYLCDEINLTKTDKNNLKPLDYAYAGGNAEIIRILQDALSSKKYISNRQRAGAALFHCNNVFDWLTNVHNDKSEFFLSWCGKSNNFYCALHFLESNFYNYPNTGNVNNIDKEYSKAVLYSLKYNNVSFFRFLMHFPFSFEFSEKYMVTYAIRNNNPELVELVLEFDPISSTYAFQNNESKNSIVRRIIIPALNSQNTKIIDIVLQNNSIIPFLNMRYNKLDRESLANAIIQTNDRQIIHRFIGFNNIFHGSTSIEHYIEKMAKENDLESISNLVNDDYFKIRRDWSPLPYAESVETALFFIEKGTNIDSRDKDGKTCLYYATKNGNNELVKLLLQYGATVDQNLLFFDTQYG